MTSFALCDEHLFYGDVSLFDQTAAGPLNTLCEGEHLEFGEFGVYYTDMYVDPTGRYLAVNGANGTGWSFLWDVDHARSMKGLYESYLQTAWSEDGSGVSQGDVWDSVDSDKQVQLQSQRAAYNRGKEYWLTSDAIMMRPLGNNSGPATTIATVDTRAGQDEFDWSRILGFVDGNVLVRVGARILICNDAGVVGEIDAGSAFTRSVVSLQYIFEPRKPSR
jgi:hypothetical protein